MIGRSLGPLKALLPAGARRRLGAWHRERVLRRALARFARDPSALAAGGGVLAHDLVYGWGNDTWSALDEYLGCCVEHALKADGPILECGSGLTTLLLGIVAARTGNVVWTLEHDPAWLDRVAAWMPTVAAPAVRLCRSPLRLFQGFSWYDAPLSKMPARFSLVICDGPPYDTPGARYGLVPVMRDRLAPGAVILLDDAARAEERVAMDRWAAELGTRAELLGTVKPYARIVVPSREAAP